MAFDHKKFPFSTLDTALSTRCCLTCGFCYAKNDRNGQYDKECMDLTFKWFFNQYVEKSKKLEKPKNEVSINFYGGEPILEWEHLIEEVPLRRREAEILDLKADFTAVSNLVLLNDEKIEWCKKNGVSVSCSIDGCQEAEDYWRKFPDGTGASEKVFENAKKLVNLGMTNTVRMTSTPETVKWFAKSVKFLYEELGFSTVNCVTASGQTWSNAQIETYKSQIHETTDWWIENVRQGKWMQLFYLNKRLPSIWGKPRERGGCSAGLTMICADTNGLLWPCHRFAGGDPKSKYCLGNIHNGITNNEMLDRLAELSFCHTWVTPKCSICQSRFACNSFCINEMANNGDKQESQECDFITAQTQEAIRAHNTLMKEKNPLFLEHYRLKTTGNISNETHQKYLARLKEIPNGSLQLMKKQPNAVI